MKLTVAKCPSCGASLEVNKKLEKAICQYCGDTILVEDAIAKVKVEHSGTVKLSSVKDSSDKIEIAKKFLKVGNLEGALNTVREILDDNPFDLDALVVEDEIILELMKDNLDIIKEKRGRRYNDMKKHYGEEFANDMEKDDYENKSKFMYSVRNQYNGVIKDIETIKKLDDKNEYQEIIKKYEKELNEIDSFLKPLEESHKINSELCDELRKKINFYVQFGGLPYNYRRLRKLFKRYNLKLVRGCIPNREFIIKKVTENNFEYEVKNSNKKVSLHSDVDVSLEEKIKIVDELIKRMKLIDRIVTIVLFIPSIILFLFGHWFLALIVLALLFAGLNGLQQLGIHFY